MNSFNASLPSEKMMKSLCHGNPDQWLPVQALCLIIVVTPALFVLFSMLENLAGGQHFELDGGAGGTSPEDMLERLQSTIIYALASAAALVALAVFVKTYLRSQFGAPMHFSELQADLPQESVAEMCRDYMQAHSLYDSMQVEPSRGRMIGLIYKNRNSSTFLEITTLAMEADRTCIVVRGASIVVGKAALLSAFYNDFGAARESTNKMMDIFAPYASRQRRRSGRISQQAIPAIKAVVHNPPPLSSRPHKLGWRLHARPDKSLT